MKNLKQIIYSMLIISMIFTSCFVFNTYAAKASLKINAQQNVKVGDVLNLTVDLSGNTGWGALGFKLNYNKELLECVSSSKGSATGSSSASINDNGTDITAILFNDENIVGDGTILNAEFKVLAIGKTTFSLELTDYYDVDLNILDCNLENATVELGDKTTVPTNVTTTVAESTTEVTTKATAQVTTKEQTTQVITKEPAKEQSTKAPATQTTTKEVTIQVSTKEDTTESTTLSETQTTVRRTSSGGGGGSGRAKNVEEAKTETSTETESTSVVEETRESHTETIKTKVVKVRVDSDEIEIDGKTFNMDAKVYIQKASSSTLVPLRFVTVAFTDGSIENANKSGIVKWDAQTKTATVTVKGKNVSFTSGSEIMYIDGVPNKMENGVKAEIKENRMYIPFRSLGEAIGAKVEWDAQTKTAIYS